jgi:hypothetical protein
VRARDPSLLVDGATITDFNGLGRHELAGDLLKELAVLSVEDEDEDSVPTSLDEITQSPVETDEAWPEYTPDIIPAVPDGNELYVSEVRRVFDLGSNSC